MSICRIVTLVLAALVAAGAAAATPGSGRQDHPKLSPFRAMRRAGDGVEVQVDDERWYVLERVGGVPAARLLAWSRAAYGGRWWKRVTEDLVEVLSRMGHAPGRSVDLVLRVPETGERVRMRAVPMTREKRQRLWRANQVPEADAPRRLSAEDVGADLEALRRLLDERFSYRHRRPVDLEGALEVARRRLGAEPCTRRELALAVSRVLALFGDAHSRVGMRRSELYGRGYLPFLVEEAAGGLVAFRADRSGFVDDERPFLVALDGLPAERWLACAEEDVPRGSAALRRRSALRHLRFLQHLRRSLGRPETREVTVTLADADGRAREVRLDVAGRRPLYGEWPRTGHRELPGGFGYLRLASMDDDAAFLRGLDAAMERFLDTKGLVIDVRGNSGGSRAALRTLLPWFLAPGSPPAVVNVAAYRLEEGDDPARPDGHLANRWLFPAAWRGWSRAERRSIARLARGFEPEWRPSERRFSDWHYMVVAPREGRAYGKPVVVLMNHDCFSATDVFLGAFAGRRGVTLLGTASSGGSGRARRYRLPRSGLELRLSSMASFRPDGRLYDGNGIAPDVVVRPRATDFVGRTDTQLDAALGLLRR